MGCRERKFAHTFHPAFGELVAAELMADVRGTLAG